MSYIPNDIFRHVQLAQHTCHGARLERGDRAYHLSNEKGCVRCVLFVTVSSDDLAEYDKLGFETSPGTAPELNNKYPQLPVRPPKAWKSIPLSQVPSSQPSEWETWDEV